VEGGAGEADAEPPSGGEALPLPLAAAGEALPRLLPLPPPAALGEAQGEALSDAEALREAAGGEGEGDALSVRGAVGEPPPLPVGAPPVGEGVSLRLPKGEGDALGEALLVAVPAPLLPLPRAGLPLPLPLAVLHALPPPPSGDAVPEREGGAGEGVPAAVEVPHGEAVSADEGGAVAQDDAVERAPPPPPPPPPSEAVPAALTLPLPLPLRLSDGAPEKEALPLGLKLPPLLRETEPLSLARPLAAPKRPRAPCARAPPPPPLSPSHAL
jgi:hypothetical protein